ncbi:zinc-binding alcohol dehydrogenase family protein [Nemorincola caseinilytica]|uniref:Zinc-binding alcohol dehydrogenase family protein n=1 Tax=Nemorincola caseinilytica TaxID=2054315 RepID=A0ABP8N606_9BACT
MKAAIINDFGELPQYKDFPDPVVNEGETLVHVRASVLENFDKGTAKGTHYSSKKLFPQFPAIVGTDGIGVTEDGRTVGFGNMKPPYGAFAEKAAAGYIVPAPVDIDPAKVAAIPPSVLASLLPLKYSAKLLHGETVLINGAIGVSGRIAIQVAKMLGAGKVIGTGRNEQSLGLLTQLGADIIIDLKQPEDRLQKVFERESRNIDVVIDFLWGHPAEILINTFIPNEAGFAKRNIRYIQIGEMAGSHISLPGSALRTSGLQMMGVGKVPMETLFEEVENVYNLIRTDKFYMDIERVPLSEIASAWQQTDTAGKRIVIVP